MRRNFFKYIFSFFEVRVNQVLDIDKWMMRESVQLVRCQILELLLFAFFFKCLLFPSLGLLART